MFKPFNDIAITTLANQSRQLDRTDLFILDDHAVLLRQFHQAFDQGLHFFVVWTGIDHDRQSKRILLTSFVSQASSDGVIVFFLIRFLLVGLFLRRWAFEKSDGDLALRQRPELVECQPHLFSGLIKQVTENLIDVRNEGSHLGIIQHFPQ